MPTLEVQLAKSQKNLAALEEVMKIGRGHYYWRPKRADQEHGNEAELRGLKERVRHLQQRLVARNERAELRAAAQTLMMLREQTVQLPLHVTHTSEPTAPA